MKSKILILLVLVMIVVGCSSNKQEVKVKQLKTLSVELYVDEEFTVKEVFTYTYDEKGNQIEEYLNGEKIKDYEYNDKNQKVKTTFIDGRTMIFKYNEKGEEIEVVSNYKSGALYSVKTSEFYADGLKKLIITDYGDDYIEKEEYQPLSDNKQSYSMSINDEVVLESNITYDDKNRSLYEDIKYTDLSYGISEYTYDKWDKYTKLVSTLYDVNDNVISVIYYDNEFDEEGNVVKLTRVNERDGSVTKEIYTYEYES